MKSEKGITIVSLAIYIALIFIVLGILATITANIRNSVDETNKDGEKLAEVNKFNMYFIKEVKDEQNDVEQINTDSITFTNGKTFRFDNVSQSIKLIDGTSQIEIAVNIENCTFSKKLDNGYVLNTEKMSTTYVDEKDYTSKTNTIQNTTTE